MRFIHILFIIYVYTALASSVQEESTNVADLFPPIDSFNQAISQNDGNLASSNNLIAAESPFIPASPSVSLNPDILSSPSIAANPFIAADPTDPTASSNQNSPFDQTASSNSVQVASSGKRKGHCSPGGTEITGKVRRAESSCRYSWQDDPDSREDFICPIEFWLLCCRGPVVRFFFTLGCSECKRSLLCFSCSS